MPVESRNYAELYPKCTNCPMLAKAQRARDSLSAQYEQAEIASDLKRAEQAHRREQLEGRYLGFLDRVDSCSVSEEDPRITEVRELYGVFDENRDKAEKAEDSNNMLADRTINSLARILYDNPARKLTRNCHDGPRNVPILGSRGVFCRSEVKRMIDIMPQPPMS